MKFSNAFDRLCVEFGWDISVQFNFLSEFVDDHLDQAQVVEYLADLGVDISKIDSPISIDDLVYAGPFSEAEILRLTLEYLDKVFPNDRVEQVFGYARDQYLPPVTYP